MLIKRLLILPALVLLFCGTANAGQKAPHLRFGYLDDPGSALVLLAAEHGHFKGERLSVSLVKYGSAAEGLAALAAGKIEAGAFPAGDVLRAIARELPDGHKVGEVIKINEHLRGLMSWLHSGDIVDVKALKVANNGVDSGAAKDAAQVTP